MKKALHDLSIDRAVEDAKKELLANGERIATEHLKHLAGNYLKNQVEAIFIHSVKPDIDKMLSTAIRERLAKRLAEEAQAMVSRRADSFIVRATKKIREI